MASCQDVITKALRRLNAIPIGVTPPAAQLANALGDLQSIYTELAALGAFGSVNDILTNGDWTVFPQSRVRMNNPDGAANVPDDLPVYPDWAYWPNWWSWNRSDAWFWPICPCGTNPIGCHAPDDLSMVQIVDPGDPDNGNFGSALMAIYDATVGRWGAINNLTLAQEAPLSRRWFIPVANELAVRLAPDYGRAPPAVPPLSVLGAAIAVGKYFGNNNSRPVAMDAF